MAAKTRLTAYLMLVFLTSYVSSRGKVPRWITRPKPEYEVQVGRRVRIKCIFTGMDDPLDNRTLVAWQKVGEGWIHSKSRYKINKKGLRILNAQPGDSGRYMCVAHNKNGFQNATANLIVKGKPTLSERSSTKSVSSDKARLPIQPFISTPRPKLWRGRPGQRPQFIESPSKHRRVINQVSGRSVRLKCRATGRPNPKITWRRDDKKLSRSQQQHLTGKGWILAFDHLLMNDAGKYTCRVKNSLGTISRIFHVRVAPNDVPKGFTIQKGVLHNVTATEGDNATFVCKAIGAGNQPVHVSWLKLNWNFSAPKSKNDSAGEYQLITHTNQTLGQKLFADKPKALPGTRKLSFTNRLMLLHVTKEDEGRYTCMVGNKAGFKSVHAFLTVKPKPGAVVVKSRKHHPEIKEDIPIAAFIGVPLVVAAVLIASIVWCFTHTRKSRGKSSSEATAHTTEVKLALKMRGLSHERSNEYTPPPNEQLQSRNCNDHAVLYCNNRAPSTCDGHNCDSHAVSQCNGCDSPKRDSQSSCQFTHKHSDHQQPVEHMSRKEVSGESELSHNIYKLPSDGTITKRASVQIEANNTFRPQLCSCKTNTGSSESSL